MAAGAAARGAARRRRWAAGAAAREAARRRRLRLAYSWPVRRIVNGCPGHIVRRNNALSQIDILCGQLHHAFESSQLHFFGFLILSAINITKNLVQHSWTKHIKIWYHFLRVNVEKCAIALEFVESEKQLADIFTKQLDRSRFEFLRSELGVIHPYGLI
uniref:Retrotransposon protein, putative, unclassified n=1 Tax=Oryza sativa subsp. japonica TaxID=39947 RepID=Q2QSC1_ORYSJ|nr:hypothetical protein LOC_Os12g24630 [Oryza sativa Japonica Group]